VEGGKGEMGKYKPEDTTKKLRDRIQVIKKDALPQISYRFLQ
jgi:hypothetical protein